MMQQYLEIKQQYPDAFLFYRLGDFYEMFYDDALKAAQLLELTLTSRNRNADEPIPMCGVPHHAAQAYIETLTEKGYKVAICEQMEDPKTTKGMVKREVIQLITPGTVMDGKTLDAKENNYLTALIADQLNGDFGFAYTDLSTGELKTSILADESSVINECAMLQTKEIVIDDTISLELQQQLSERLGLVISKQKDSIEEVDFAFLSQNLSQPLEKAVLNKLLTYLTQTQKRQLTHMQAAISYEPAHYLKIDHFSKVNLELTQSIRNGKKKGTLLWLLDETKTAMGGRLLKQWLERPLIQKEKILARQAKTASLLNAFFERNDLQIALTKVYDLERLAGKVAFGNINGRELIQLKASLEQIPQIRQLLTGIDQGEWTDFLLDMDPVDDVVALIAQAIQSDPPLSITEGNIIRDGYHSKLDEYRDAMHNGKIWLAELEAKEREATGIKTLKIGFNRVFGYYIEITKANLALLPEGKYERKQTLANAERFITPELKEMEQRILEAEEQSVDLEYRLFLEIREQVKAEIGRIQKLASAVAAVDVIQSFAVVSENGHFVQPQLHANSQSLYIKEGRHPVVEKVLGQQKYVPNSVEMDESTMILLITGPNMSGKSTYMRQLALTVIMAQIGCFVPAEEAQLPIFDQIFTRIGATDDLFSGQSTFMVEMMEANQALQHATSASLILFDELGRGTATYDGIALAQAIIEYIHKHVKAKTLFSTHYHELTVLEDTLANLKNVHVGAVEQDGEVVFLHKLMDGPADKSYGIHVAKLAGLPSELLERAATVLASLEASASSLKQPKIDVLEEPKMNEQMSLFTELTSAETEALQKLQAIDLLNITPLEALNLLYELQKQL